jgi:putative colanic acid biosysnthesis UDP-glucose lipid carrier transferase
MHTQIHERTGLFTSSQDVVIEDTLYNSENLLKLKGRLARTSKSKRLADVILSLVGLFILGLIFPIIALMIKLSSRGPVVFKQDRVGYNGEIFQVYKFRTMHVTIPNDDIDANKPVVTQVGDKRLFAFGSLLRKLNLDELPQLLNVLKGEMTLVGPRPYPVEEANYWAEHINKFQQRHFVKPGITGLSQVTGYRGGTHDIEHMTERLRRDLRYIERFSIITDMKIVWKTILQMLHLNTGAH